MKKIKAIFIFIFLFIIGIYITSNINVMADNNTNSIGNSDETIGYTQKTQYGYYTRKINIINKGTTLLPYKAPGFAEIGNEPYKTNKTYTTYTAHSSYNKYVLDNIKDRYTHNGDGTYNQDDRTQQDTEEDFAIIMGNCINDSINGADSSRKAERYIYAKETLNKDLSKWNEYYTGDGWYYNCTEYRSFQGFLGNQYDYLWEAVYLEGHTEMENRAYIWDYTIEDSDVIWYDSLQESQETISHTLFAPLTYTITKFYGTRQIDDKEIKDRTDDYKVIASPETISGTYKIIKYKNDGTNTVSSNNNYTNSSSINSVGKYKVINYSDSFKTPTSAKAYYYIENKNIYLTNIDGTPITESTPTNDNKVYLHFETKLHHTYLKECIQKITIGSQTYTGDTKNEIIDGTKSILVSVNQETTCIIDDGTIFNSYTFTIDTASPTLNFEGINENEIIVKDNTLITSSDGIKFSWDEKNCIFLKDDKTISSENTYIITNDCKVELQDKAGNSTIFFVKIIDVNYLKIISNQNTYNYDYNDGYYNTNITLNLKPSISESTYLEPEKKDEKILDIKYKYTITKDGEIVYSKNEFISNEENIKLEEEGTYTITINYNIGGTFTRTLTIDKTAPFMALNYLLAKGYNSSNVWYNTYDKDGNDKIIYSFSFRTIDSTNNLNYASAYSYALEREKKYTIKLPYNENEEYLKEYSIFDIGLITPSGFGDSYNQNNSDGYVYIYKSSNWKTTGKYVVYFGFDEYNNQLKKIANESIEEINPLNPGTYNPCPDIDGKKYYTFFTYNDYPIFYVQSLNLKTLQNNSLNEIGNTTYNITKITNGINEIIETDKAGNSTTYFVYLCNINPVAVIYNDKVVSNPDTDGIYYLTQNLKIEPAINDGSGIDIYKYSIIQYKIDNGNWQFFNCYNFIENDYQNLQFLENGKYDIKVYSATGLASSTYTIYLYKDGISNSIEVLVDTDGEERGLSIEFEAINPVISEGQFSQLTIKRDGEILTIDTKNNSINLKSNKNKYSFYFETNGLYEIIVVDKFHNYLHDKNNYYSYKIELNLGSPNGKLIKVVKTPTTIEEQEITGQTYLIHNYIVKFTWNPTKNYHATLNGITYISGSNITQEGTYELILMNGENENLNKTYTIVIDKTAPVGYFIDSLITDEYGFILNSSGNTTTNKITDQKYVSGNRKGVSFASDEEVYVSKVNNEIFDKNRKFTGEENKELEIIITLQDEAGNQSTYTLILDYKIANVYLKINTTNLITEPTYWTNKPFSFTWNEKDVNVEINSETYQSGKKIILEDTTTIKEYSIYISDKYGNKQYLTIYYDNTTPTLNLSKISFDGTKTNISNGSKINGGFEISWLESKYYTVNISYYDYENQKEENITNIKNGTIINTELDPNSSKLSHKKYTIKVSNLAGTEKEYYIYLCNTFYDVNVYNGTTLQNPNINNFITNKFVRFSWTNTDTTATLNGGEYTSYKKIEENGIYELTITDEYGNQYKYNFEIDTIAPELELKTSTTFVGNGTNGDITIISKEEINYNLEYTKDGETYIIPSNYLISNEGEYIIKLTDKAGNFTEKKIVIDKTAPEFKSTGFTLNPTITQNTVKFSWTEADTISLLNENNYKSNDAITEDGNYTFILKDKYGNSNIFTFTIDTKLIEYIITGINENNYSNSYVIFTYNVDKYKATINGETYIMGSKIEEENEYTIIFSSIEIPDKTKKYNFIIDKTAPELKLETTSSTGFVIENEIYYTNNSFTINYSSNDVCIIDDGTITKEVLSGKYYSAEGTYTIKLTDKAGNSTTKIICIDKKDISFLIFDSNDSIQSYVLNENSTTTKNNFYKTDIKLSLPEGSKATLNGNEYTSEEVITIEGNYEMILINKLGTKSNFIFTIDKTAPVITLNGTNSNNKSSSTVRLEIEDSNSTKVYTVSYELNEDNKEVEVLTETNLLNFVANGKYDIKVIDSAGNVSTTHFDILRRNLNDNIKIQQAESKENIIINIDGIENYTIYVDNEVIENLNTYNTPGKHQLKVEDEYGNQYLTSFTINAPKVVSRVFNNVMTIILVVGVAGLIITLIIKKTKSSKKNPYTKG